MKAKWPVVGEIDEALVGSSVYLMDIAHEFRIRHKNFIAAKSKASAGKSKDKNAPPPAPATPVTITGATIYVSKTFPQWQQIILDTLKKLHSVRKKNTFFLKKNF